MSEPPTKRRGLGLWMCTALVVGNMVGSGVFLLPAALAPYGGISVFGWLFTTLGALVLALLFSRLSRIMPKVGGPYAYTRAGFGDYAAFLVAWGYWISIMVGNAAISIGFVGYVSFFWPALADTGWAAALVALAAIWTLTWVNAAGVRNAGWVQLATTVLKLLPLIAIGTLGFFFLEPANFRPLNPSGASAFSAITASATLTLWAFLGLESATVPADDVENPQRVIPRATVVGTLVAAAVYILGTVAVMGVIPSGALADSTAPFADAAVKIWGSWAGHAVAAGAAISAFGALNGWILLQAQIPLAAARDRLFPIRFGRLSGQGTPAFGLVASSVLVTALMAFNYTKGLVELFTFMVLLATLTTLIPYVFSAMAQLLIFINERERFAGEKLLGSSIVAALAFVYSVWAIGGSGRDTVFWGFLLLLAGTPVYVWIQFRRKAVETSGG